MVGSAHGQLTFKRSHRLARGKALESLRTQTRRMVPPADSRGPGRERGAARQGARASGAGSRGSRLSGRSVDVRESGYSDPKRVWGKLPSGSRESFSQGFEAKLAETAAPG